MEEMEKGIVKANRFYRFKEGAKRVFATVMTIVMVFAASVGLIACNGGEEDTSTDTESSIVDTNTDTQKPPVDTETDSNLPGNSNTETDSSTNTETNTDSSQTPDNPELPDDPVTPDVPVEPENTTFEEFMAEHGSMANQFALDQIEQISYNEKALSTSYTFVANENNIEKIIVAQVVAGEGDTRELKIAEISFANGVDFDDIIAGEGNFIPVITSETALTFDAKEEFLKGDSSTIEDQIAEEINEALGDNAIQHEEYKPETFTPETVEDLAQMYPEEVNKTLTDRFLVAALKTGRGSSLDAALVHNAKWIMKGGKEVTDVDFVFHYGDSDSQAYYVINLTFASPLEIEAILNNDDSLNDVSSTRTQKYSFGYNVSIQGTRDELMNAIFKANGMSETCPEGAVRLIKDNGAHLDTEMGQVQDFIVVEIYNGQINQFGIRIKRETSDIAYINNLKSASKYSKLELERKEINISGEEVEYIAPAAATTLSVKAINPKTRKITLSNGMEVEYKI